MQSSWLPANWHPIPLRLLPTAFKNELARHVDALGQPVGSEAAQISRALSNNTVQLTVDAGTVTAAAIPLLGDNAYPRPGALLAGITAGSPRVGVHKLLSATFGRAADTLVVEGVQLSFSFDDGGLAGMAVERQPALPTPGDGLNVILALLGEQIDGPAFQKVAQLAGIANKRWMDSGLDGRLICFANGVDVAAQSGRVHSGRVRIGRFRNDSSLATTDGFFTRLRWPCSREDVHAALGAPVTSSGGKDLHVFERHNLLVAYGVPVAGQTPLALTAVLHGAPVKSVFYKWRSGEFAKFLDALGLPPSNPLVGEIQSLPGTKVTFKSGVVFKITIGTSGHQAERFAAFVDGMPAEPTGKDIPFGRAGDTGAHGDLWQFPQGWVLAYQAQGMAITTLTVTAGDRPGFDLIHYGR